MFMAPARGLGGRAVGFNTSRWAWAWASLPSFCMQQCNWSTATSRPVKITAAVVGCAVGRPAADHHVRVSPLVLSSPSVRT